MATIFKNAYLIDPTQGLEGRGDVLVEHGKIVGVLQDTSAIGKIVPILVPQWDTEIVDLDGAFLSPGWIDIHTHIFDAIGDFCLNVDDVGIRSGVTTVADAGSSGILTFDAFRRTAIAAAKTRAYAFMNPSLLYIATADQIADRLDIVANPRNQDIDRAAATVEANRDAIVGFKVSPVRQAGQSHSPVLQAARSLSDMFSLPLMVQLGAVGSQGIPPAELLSQLKSGDIVTQCFQAQDGLFDSAGALLPAAKDAIARGILLDVGYSETDFALGVAQSALATGILPDTLSTNLSAANANSASSLSAALSLFVRLGLSLADVVERVTSRAAKAIGKSNELGGFKPGQLADFTIFEWADEPVSLGANSSDSLPPSQRLQVKGVYHNGEYLRIERSPFAIAEATTEPAIV
jgi:dihydroorotase